MGLKEVVCKRTRPSQEDGVRVTVPLISTVITGSMTEVYEVGLKEFGVCV